MKSLLKTAFLAICVLLAGQLMAQSSDMVLLAKPTSNKVVIKFRFKVGSYMDPAGQEGLTHLTANLVAQGGTQSMTKSQIDDMLYPMAANYGVLVDKEVTTFTFEVHNDFVDQLVPLMEDLMLGPRFDSLDYARVLSNQQNFVSRIIRSSSDEEYSKKALEHYLFRGTTYAHLKQGTEASVPNLGLAAAKQFYKQYFTKNNLTIGVAGNYDQALLDKLTAIKNGLPNRQVEYPAVPAARTPNGIEVEIVAQPNALGSAIFTGAPLAATRSSSDFAALMVANSWLGEHRKSYSRLYQKIREQRSMNYGDYTYIEWYEAGGSNQLPLTGVPRSSNYFSIWIRPVQIKESLVSQYPELQGIEVGHAHFALRMAIKEIDALVENGMTQETFEGTRDFLRSYIKLYIQTPNKELGFLMDSRFYGRQDYLAEMDEALANLTLAQVNATIKKYLQTKNMFVTIVTDDSEAQALAQSLLQNRPSPMSYSNVVAEGLPASITQEDATVATYPLNVTKVTVVPTAQTFKAP